MKLPFLRVILLVHRSAWALAPYRRVAFSSSRAGLVRVHGGGELAAGTEGLTVAELKTALKARGLKVRV